MTIDITQIINWLIYLIFLIISGILIPLIKQKLTTEQEKNLAYWVDVAVMAAEGMFTQTGMGEVKYEYVLNFLAKKGFKADLDEVEAMVESSVYQLINQFKEVTPDGNGE